MLGWQVASGAVTMGRQKRAMLRATPGPCCGIGWLGILRQALPAAIPRTAGRVSGQARGQETGGALAGVAYDRSLELFFDGYEVIARFVSLINEDRRRGGCCTCSAWGGRQVSSRQVTGTDHGQGFGTSRLPLSVPLQLGAA